MHFRHLCAVIAGLILAGCVALRTADNLRHTHISPDVQLPKVELEHVVREVTRRTLNPIVCITRIAAEYPDGITVYTDVEHEPWRFGVYDLRKDTDGKWHSSFRGVSSIIACP